MLRFLTLFKFLFNFVNNLLIRYPLPKNIGYMWNYGFLSSIALVIQLSTGLFLAMFYTPHVDAAFYSVDHIMHDVMYGWLVRLLHLNTASFFFLFVYIHILRGLYYKSYHAPRYNTWLTGVTIYLLLMAAAFLGYVLPWGQMSFWAATVITNFFTSVPVIGNDLVVWIWGGYSINNATLNRFFCLHYLLPFIVLVLVLFHIFMLHSTGSSNELKIKNCINANIKCYPFFIIKDLFTICFFFILLIFILFFYPEMLNHSINYIHSNPLVTPNHIVPEWYFLPFYAILRCISNKELGILYMLFSIVLLYFLPKLDLPTNKVNIHNTLYKEDFWIFFFNLVFLGFLGMEPINNVSITFALVCTGIHFIFLLNPYVYTNNTLTYLEKKNTFFYAEKNDFERKSYFTQSKVTNELSTTMYLISCEYIPKWKIIFLKLFFFLFVYIFIFIFKSILIILLFSVYFLLRMLYTSVTYLQLVFVSLYKKSNILNYLYLSILLLQYFIYFFILLISNFFLLLVNMICFFFSLFLIFKLNFFYIIKYYKSFLFFFIFIMTFIYFIPSSFIDSFSAYKSQHPNYYYYYFFILFFFYLLKVYLVQNKKYSFTFVRNRYKKYSLSNFFLFFIYISFLFTNELYSVLNKIDACCTDLLSIYKECNTFFGATVLIDLYKWYTVYKKIYDSYQNKVNASRKGLYLRAYKKNISHKKLINNSKRYFKSNTACYGHFKWSYYLKSLRKDYFYSNKNIISKVKSNLLEKDSLDVKYNKVYSILKSNNNNNRLFEPLSQIYNDKLLKIKSLYIDNKTLLYNINAQSIRNDHILIKIPIDDYNSHSIYFEFKRQYVKLSLKQNSFEYEIYDSFIDPSSIQLNGWFKNKKDCIAINNNNVINKELNPYGHKVAYREITVIDNNTLEATSMYHAYPATSSISLGKHGELFPKLYDSFATRIKGASYKSKFLFKPHSVAFENSFAPNGWVCSREQLDSFIIKDESTGYSTNQTIKTYTSKALSSLDKNPKDLHSGKDVGTFIYGSHSQEINNSPEIADLLVSDNHLRLITSSAYLVESHYMADIVEGLALHKRIISSDSHDLIYNKIPNTFKGKGVIVECSLPIL